MKILTLLLALLSAGCMSDQYPYTRNIAWNGASLACAPSTDLFRYPELILGTNIVLESTEGYSHGRWSTAHGSHDSIFLTITEMPQPCHTLNFSYTNGTLDYNGFHGYYCWILDTNMPASAELSITSVSSNKIEGTLQGSVYRIRDDCLNAQTSPSRVFGFVRNVAFKKEESKNKLPAKLFVLPPDDKLPSRITYTVKKGESLIDISKMYGISMEEIKKANNLTGSKLDVGQTLTIPVNYK